MKPTNLVVVIGHKGSTMGTAVLGEEPDPAMTQAIFDRHLPFWEHHGWPIIVITPKTKPLDTTHERIFCGDHGHSGANAYSRVHCLLKLLSERRYRFAIIHEYDSICLDQSPRMRIGLCGNVWPNYDPSRFMTLRYANPPWTLDRRSAVAMWEAMNRWPDVEEEGFNDRLLPALAEIAGVPMLGFNNEGYSNDTLLERDRDMLEFRIKRKRACWIHGIKTEAALNVVLKAWKERETI